jgi:hypothetical protein
MPDDEEPDKAKELFAVLKEDTARGRSVLCAPTLTGINIQPMDILRRLLELQEAMGLSNVRPGS